MRQHCQPEDEGPIDSYTAYLTEDMQLFSQLGNLELSPDFELVQLLNDTDQQAQSQPLTLTSTSVEARPKRKNAATSKRLTANICDVCKRSYSDAYTLRIHMMTHTNERPHVCKECGKGFRQLNKLRMHAVTHTDKRPHECDICGKGYRFANYLSVHRRLHTGEKPYTCSEAKCQMSFHSIHARRMHVKLQHAASRGPAEAGAEVKPQQVETASLSYTCPICGRILTDQCYLNTHLKRHYNQRDFICPQPQCGKRFFSSSELNHHQIAHTRLRPFHCALCSSCFLRKSNYKQHLKLHNSKDSK